jgi:hypothetical protein
MQNDTFRVLATRCHTSTCCPTIMESGTGEDIVIVGNAASTLLRAQSVIAKIGDSEAAVVIPRDLLLEAVKALRS